MALTSAESRNACPLMTTWPLHKQTMRSLVTHARWKRSLSELNVQTVKDYVVDVATIPNDGFGLNLVWHTSLPPILDKVPSSGPLVGKVS